MNKFLAFLCVFASLRENVFCFSATWRDTELAAISNKKS